jgi:hypothetical protein
LNPKLSGPINPVMIVQGIAQKLMKALLALALILASEPVLQASASPMPCDCPSMHMQSVGHQPVPGKQKILPCNEMQNCMCGAMCGMAMTLPQDLSAAVAARLPQKFSWPELGGASGHSNKPAIPPPIASA